MGTSKLWRYTVGKKGVSRVTVFERRDAPSLYIEWWDDTGRNKRALATVAGHPVTDRELAKEIARRVSEAQERKRNQTAREALGIPARHTLPELLAVLHDRRQDDWSEGYRKSQERQRRFWTRKLGDMELRRITPALVERVAAEEAKQREWSPRTEGAYLRYLVDAFTFAQKKLKWITERENLSAVDVPQSERKVAAYTMEEIRKLLPALEEVDERAGWIGHVAFQTGRRLRAIRTLKNDAPVVHDDHTLLRFPAETDKAGNEGRAVVVGRAHELTRKLVGSPGRYVLGKKPPANSICHQWILDAEEAAGVEHKRRRGWHGIKRLYATVARGLVGRDQQSGTTGQTLDRIYVQDDLPPKVKVARELAGKLGAE